MKINKPLILETVLEHIRQQLLGNEQSGSELEHSDSSNNNEQGSMSPNTNQFMGQKSSDTYMANKQSHEAAASLGK